MSLIKCNECGKEISDKATTCPNCGCPISVKPKDEAIKNNAKKKKSHTPSILIIIICIIAFSAIVNGISKSTKKEESDKTVNSNVSNESTARVEPTTESYIGVNEESKIEDWSVLITSAGVTDKISENNTWGFTPKEGNKYFKIDCTITNNGTNAHTFLPSLNLKNDISAKIIYKTEYEYTSTILLGYSNDLHDTTVNPLSTKSGSIAFEIPDSIATTNEELILVISAGRKNIKFKVR